VTEQSNRKPPDAEEAAQDCKQSAVIHALYQRFGRAMIAKTRRIITNDELAQEVVQEAFLRLCRLGPTFVNAGEAYSWLYTCCHNLAVDHLRAVSRRKTDALDDAETLPDHADKPSAETLVVQDATLAACLAELEHDEARIFVYHTVDGMTQEEIAEACGVARKTVQRSLARIETKLATLRPSRRISA
jgi:RNA polymerase sigma-70 factor (ECF subfamily)